MAEHSEVDLREQVRVRYATAATQVAAGQPGPPCGDAVVDFDEPGSSAALYSDTERAELPEDAVAASLGCGNPLTVANLREGETVLDLGSGGGMDVLLSARRVGSAGKVYGLDMTEEMLALALANARKAGATNVEFLKGHVEAIPLAAQTVNVVISHCVVNLSSDKPAVFAEIFRVLKPGGRMGISDAVAEDDLALTEHIERGQSVGCVAESLSISEYRDELAVAGFANIEITPTMVMTEGIHAALVQASKAATAMTAGAATDAN